MAHVEKHKRKRAGKPDLIRWRARWTDPAGVERCCNFSRKIDAERHAATVEADKLRGTYVDPAAGQVTLATYAEAWRQAQDHRPSTADLYQRVLRIHVYPILGDRPMASVRHSEARAFVTGLSRGLAPNTARQVHAITRTIFRSAVSDRIITATPFAEIRLPRVERDRVEPVTVEQVRTIVAAAPERLRALILLAAGTGLRSGELLGLTVDRVDFLRREVRVDRALVYVPGSPPYMGPPKTRESVRTVPVPTFALEALAAHLAAFPAGPDGLIFQSDKGGPLLRTSLHGRWVLTLRRAGLSASAVHFHHLRHHYASVLIDGGESVKVVQSRLGHASPEETLRTYTHLWPTSNERTRSVVDTAWATAQTDPRRTRDVR